jgi:hypothetical protein
VVKGNSNNLMKITSKRRRPKAQIALEKKQEEEREANIAKRLAQMDELEKQMAKMQTEISEQSNYKQLVDDLFGEGMLKTENDGSITMVENP